MVDISLVFLGLLTNVHITGGVPHCMAMGQNPGTDVHTNILLRFMDIHPEKPMALYESRMCS